MTEPSPERLEAFNRRKNACITHMENHRIYFQPGDRYEKVLFHHSNLHFPEDAEGDTIHFKSCVFWGCRYFRGETEVTDIVEAMGGEANVNANNDDLTRARNKEGFRVL